MITPLKLVLTTSLASGFIVGQIKKDVHLYIFSESILREKCSDVFDRGPSGHDHIGA